MDKSLRIYLKIKEEEEKLKKIKDSSFNFFHFLGFFSLTFFIYSILVNSFWIHILSLSLCFFVFLFSCFSVAFFLSNKNDKEKEILFTKKEKLKKEYTLYIENNHKQIILELMNAKKNGKLKKIPIEYIRTITNYHESAEILNFSNDIKIKLTEVQFNKNNMVNQ